MAIQAPHSVYKTQRLHGAESIEQVVALLRAGECVALPTETVYGLAADASNSEAVGRIFAAKGRPKNHPLIVHLPSVEHVAKWACEVPELAWQAAEALWPGPLTLLLKKAPEVASDVTGGLDTIALRVPAKPLFLDVLKAFDGGLAAPSANRYKQLSPTAIEQVYHGLDGRIAAGLDGGQCEHGLESTIVDMVSEQPRILRAGPISQQTLQNVLGRSVAMPMQFDDVVPGNVEAHYQPDSPLALLSTEEIQQQLASWQGKPVRFLIWSDALLQTFRQLEPQASHWQAMSPEPIQFGKDLYHTLYQVDKLQPAQIILEKPPTSDDWRAINDRLRRAALPL